MPETVNWLKDSLVGKIVDGKDRALVADPALPVYAIVQECGHQAGLPVVCLYNVCAEFNSVEQFHGGFLKKDKPLEIVFVVPVRQAVQFTPVEVFVPPNKVNRHAVLVQQPDFHAPGV